MTSPTEEHTLIGHEILAKAEEVVTQDDLHQASEKGWAAAAHVVKGLLEKRDRQHDDHRLLYEAANLLAQETIDREVRTLFSSASTLHSNFHEN